MAPPAEAANATTNNKPTTGAAGGSAAAGTKVAAPSLNLYKKIAVIRKPNDSLTYEDTEGHVKSVSVEQLGDAIATAVS